MSASFIQYKYCQHPISTEIPSTRSSQWTTPVAVTPNLAPRVNPNHILESTVHHFNELLAVPYEQADDWTEHFSSSRTSLFHFLETASSFSAMSYRGSSSPLSISARITQTPVRTQAEAGGLSEPAEPTEEMELVNSVVNVYEIGMTFVLLPVTLALNALALLVFGGCHSPFFKGSLFTI